MCSILSRSTGQPSGQPTSHPTVLSALNVSIPLGSCQNFAVQAGTAVSFNGVLTTVFTGSVGVAPGTAITGSYSLGTGSVQANSASAILCAADLIIAYGAAAGATCKPNNLLPSSDLSGLTLYPGVYCSASGAFIISATTLTLDGKGSSSSEWIFQTATTLNTATATSFILQNGAQAKNVYWAIGSSATIGYSSSFQGTILAKVSITYGSSSVIVGRGLAMAAVTFAGSSSMTLPLSSALSTASPSMMPTVAAGKPTPAPTTALITSLVVRQPIRWLSALLFVFQSAGNDAQSFSPSASPSASASSHPTVVPTRTPTSHPTVVPTSVPTKTPTSHPTVIPTSVPTRSPTSHPTVVPTSAPTTRLPTGAPVTLTPTRLPTGQPTGQSSTTNMTSFES